MKVIKCEICEAVFFEDNGETQDKRSFENFVCVDCSDEIAERRAGNITAGKHVSTGECGIE